MRLYTCKHYYPFLIVPVVALIPLAIGIWCLCNYNNPFVKNQKRLVSEAVILIIVGFVFLSIYVWSYIDFYRNVFVMRSSDNLQFAEGELTEFVPTDFQRGGYDSFYIEEEQFFVSYNPMNPGYHKPAAYGGVLNKEGMRVRIGYIEYHGNKYIMSIDLMESDPGT